jgi:pyridoxine kinase
MRRVLAFSSYVAHGSVGLQASLPPLRQLGVDVIALPSILLSNHPGYARSAGAAVAPELLADMIDALAANGSLQGVDAVLTGYLPTAEHATLAAAMVARVRRQSPGATYLCDPVLGDDPDGLYIAHAAAEAIRDTLVPIADVITPNRFELAWLSSTEVTGPESAVAAARALTDACVAATSIADGPDRLANLFIAPSATWVCRSERLPDVPHGTGDLFAGLLLASLIDGASDDAALAHATGGVALAVLRSQGAQDLAMSGLRGTADVVIPHEVIKWQP